MGDQPSAQRLLEAMAVTMADQVVPVTSGGPQHAARVVANLCRILAREQASLGSAEVQESLRTLLGTAGQEAPDPGAEEDADALMRLLDERLRQGDQRFAEEALPILRRDVERRLAISKPSYLEADR